MYYKNNANISMLQNKFNTLISKYELCTKAQS